MNKIHRFFILNLIAGVGSLAFLLFLPADTKNAWVFGYSRARLGMAFVLFLVDVIFLAAVVYARAAAWETVIEKLTRHDLTMNVILILTIVGTGLCFGLFFGRFFVSDRYGAYFTRLSPFVFLASVFFLQSLFELRLRLKRGAILQGFFAILFTLLAFVYYTWALNHANTRNPDLQFSDQRAYLRIAQKARATNFKYTGDRNRMPLYPYIQALFYDPTHSDPEAFDRGKVVNIVLSLVLLILIFLIARRYLTLIPAATFTLTTAFVLFVFKAGYFQVEIFFYFMIFVTYLLMGTMITRPNIKTGVLTGAFVGLTHLTKASVLPGLGVFIAVFLFKEIVTFLRSRKESTNSVRGQSPTREYALREMKTPADEQSSRTYAADGGKSENWGVGGVHTPPTPQFSEIFPSFALNCVSTESSIEPGDLSERVEKSPAGVKERALSLVTTIVCFFVVISPYAIESKRIYGQYFYNVNSTFYLWYDTWDDAMEGTIAHGDMAGWPDMPPDQIPTFQKYLREHTPGQMLTRLFSGVQSQWRNVVNPYSHFNYPLTYFGVLALFGITGWRKIIPQIRKHFFQIGFFLAYLAGYLFLFSWFSPLTNHFDARMTYSLFLPFMFSTLLGAKKLAEGRIEDEHSSDEHSSDEHSSDRVSSLFEIISFLVLLLLLYDIAVFMPNKLLRGYFGK